MQAPTGKHSGQRNIGLIIGIASLIFILAIAAGVGAYNFSMQMTRRGYTNLHNKSLTFDSSTPTVAAGKPVNQNPHGPIAPSIEPELTPWDGASRVTVLLLGLDYRDWEAGNDYSRSDTMILLTLDPLSNTAGILSIPRDLWVAIPDFKHGKINTAYYLGDAYKLPGGGPGLAVKTVEQLLGIPINYYAQIDFGAFIRFIDEIGGIKLNIPQAITVDIIGSGAATKKVLQPGIQVLPGDWALAYARARYTEGGDFDRSQRQQQVILAIRNRILNIQMLPTLIEKADILYTQLASGIHTNLSLQEIIQLALLASQVPEENITRGAIGEEHVLFGESPDKLAILIPIPDKLHTVRDSIFSLGGAVGPQTLGSDIEKMVVEAARVRIVNASSQFGLENRTAEFLKSMGMNVVEIGQSDSLTTLTSLTYKTGKPYAAKVLFQTLGISNQKIFYKSDSGSSYDVEIVLGEDWARTNSMP